MLEIDESVWRAVIPIALSFSIALLVLATVSALIPAPYFDYESLPATQAECEAVGGEWLEDMYGEFCDIWKVEAKAYAAYQLIFWSVSLVTGLVLIGIGLFLIKNKAIAYGFLGAGLLVVLSTASMLILISPLITVVSLAVITVILVALGLKKTK